MLKSSVLEPVFQELGLWDKFTDFIFGQTVSLLGSSDDENGPEVAYYTHDVQRFLEETYNSRYPTDVDRYDLD